MKVIFEPVFSIRDLAALLLKLADEHGEGATWHGWDDGSLIVENSQKEEVAKIKCHVADWPCPYGKDEREGE
jgi:hypothetical protein